LVLRARLAREESEDESSALAESAPEASTLEESEPDAPTLEPEPDASTLEVPEPAVRLVEESALGELLAFIYDFDQQKMMKPDIQNDFSFYRRLLPKMAGKRQAVVSETDAGMISMFIAQSVPLTHAVGVHLASTHVDALPLGKLANVCCGMLNRAVILDQNLQILVLKIMTAAIVLYDRASLVGAFSNASPIKMRRCAQAITRFGGTQRDTFRNSVKYSSIHFNDAPDSVKAVLGD